MCVDSLKTMRWTLITTGVIFIILGVLSLFYPLSSLLSLAFFIGIGFIIAGINHLVPYFTLRGDPLRPGWLLPQGIIDILLGVVMLMNIGVTALMIPIMLGVWMLIAGIFRCAASFRLKRIGIPRWWVMLISGLLTLLCGAAVFFSPLVAGGLLVVSLMAATFIGIGCLAVAEASLIYPTRRQ